MARSTPENKVKNALKKYLDSIEGLWYYPAVAGPYSVAGIPDIMGCYGPSGRLLAIEVKAPGRRGEANRGCTPIQAMTIRDIQEAGGFAMVFDGSDEDWEKLKKSIGE